MKRSGMREQPRLARPIPDYAEFIIGPAHRVRPLAGPMASSGRTRWLHPGYMIAPALRRPAGRAATELADHQPEPNTNAMQQRGRGHKTRPIGEA
jgi:hypothetical protein